MKLNRRQFLIGLMAVGATIVLPVPIAQATNIQVNAAWKQLLKDPWYFDVNEFDTIVDPSIDEPKFRHQVFDADLSDRCTPESLVSDIEDCWPLTSRFQELALTELEEVRSSLEDDDTLSFLERRWLKRLAKVLGDEDDGWAAWVRLEGSAGLPKFKQVVKDWLASSIEYNDYEWFPKYSGAQGSAMGFFESLPFETLDALGVVIIEGDHPGRTYYAAELRQPMDAANAAAEELELPFRFRVECTA